MRRVKAAIRRLAPTATTVLIHGETGTGKELVARAVHEESGREPFVSVSVPELSEGVLESELFGHTRGSFTGAIASRQGLFEGASGGTLFLDEIGDTPLPVQVKLLRALETREIRPVGGTATRRVDVRIVAATNRDLAEMSRRGAFREDLFYRLRGATIHLPPLRARTGDIEMIAQVLIAEIAEAARIPVPKLDPGFVAALTRCPWKGNVRELRAVLENVILWRDGDGPVERMHLVEALVAMNPDLEPRGPAPRPEDAGGLPPPRLEPGSRTPRARHDARGVAEPRCAARPRRREAPTTVKLLAAIFVGALALARTALAAPEIPEDAVEPSALEIVQTAFDRMFNYPSVRSVTLSIHRGGSRITYRSFDVVYKKIDGRGRTLLRFTEPEYLRGNALLMIEEEDGRNDTWIYQRDLRRPRRVMAGHKGDSFYGSDLSFEDLEHHDWRRYQLRRLPDTHRAGKAGLRRRSTDAVRLPVLEGDRHHRARAARLAAAGSLRSRLERAHQVARAGARSRSSRKRVVT